MMPPVPLLTLAQDTERVLQNSQTARNAPQVGSDLTWAAWHLEAAAAGQRIVESLKAGHVGELTQLFGIQWDALEVMAMSLGFGDVMSALDLCADALYLVTGGTPKSTGGFKDMGWWTPSRATTLPPRLRAWINALLVSADWPLLKNCRHPIIHRYLQRTIAVSFTDSLATGQTSYHRSLVDISLPPPPPYTAAPTPLGNIGDLIPRLRGFGEAQYHDFCAALQATY